MTEKKVRDPHPLQNLKPASVNFTLHKDSSANGSGSLRLGKMTIKRYHLDGKTEEKGVQTPNILLYSKAGGPPCLTPDLMKDIPEISAIQLGFPEICNSTESFRNFKQGIHRFMNLDDKILFLTVRDPAQYNEYPISPNSFSVNARSGIQKIPPEEYLQIQRELRPDIFESPSIDVPLSISTKRVRKAVDATLAWFEKMFEVYPECESNIFGVIQGANDLKLRKRCIQEIKKKKVAGFVLGSFGLGESAEDRHSMIKNIINDLPNDKPRMLPGIGKPFDVLNCIELGIDLFNSNYPNEIAEKGYALLFDISPPSDNNRDVYMINLREKQYQLDTSPLKKGCKCYACLNHTKAYIHHLLFVQELLGPILLTIHNDYHYLQFFREIREQIAKDNFSKYKTWFMEVQGPTEIAKNLPTVADSDNNAET